MNDNKATLEKTFKPHWVWAIAFGSAIGWGSFVMPVDWMADAGPLGVIIGFAIGAAIMGLIGVCSGYLIHAFPVTGGAFTYSYLAFGRNHAFVCGWSLLLGYAAIVALNATAMGVMIKFLMPSIVSQGYLYTVAGWDVFLSEALIVSAVLIIFAWLNIRGSGVSGQTQFIFCITLLGAAILVAIGMALAPSTSFSNLTPPFKPGISAWSAIAAIIAISPWAFVGFDTVPQTAEEFNFSPGKATTLIIGALVIAAIHYSVMIVATGLAMPWTELAARDDTWGPGYAIQSVLGYGGLSLLVLALCMGIFTGLIGFYISTSRLMFAMSRAKALPPAFSRLHRKYKTPHNGILFVCVICLLAPWFGRSVLEWIVDMSSLGVSVAYLYYCMSAYRLFRWSKNSPETHFTRGISPFKKLIALTGSICSIGFLGLLLIPGSPAALTLPEWITLAFWVILGIIFYFIYGGEFRSIPKDKLDNLILGKG